MAETDLAPLLTPLPPGEQTKFDFDSIMQAYISYVDRSAKTAKTYICNLRQWAAWLQYRKIRNPERADVIAFRDWLLQEHEAIEMIREAPGWRYRLDGNHNTYTVICRPVTAAMYVQSIQRFYAWTDREGLYPDIAQGVHTPKVRRGSAKDRLARDEVIQVEDSIRAHARQKEESAAETARTDREAALLQTRAGVQGKRLYAMYLLAVCCGLRTIELHRANVKDLYEKNGHAWLMVYGKGHSSADEPQALPEAVYEAIKAYLAARTDSFNGSSPLFVATGNRSGGKRLAVTTISTMLKQALREAGYNSERLTPHSLRHTATSAAFNATGDLYLAQQYARHTSPATTELYIHEDAADHRRASTAEAVYQYYHGSRGEGPEKEKLDEQQLRALEQLSPKQLDTLLALVKALDQDV